MVIWLGIGMFRARAKVVTHGKDLPYNAFTAGIITSGLNPFFILWWATLGSLLVMKFVEFGAGGLTLFIIVHWLCDLLWLSLVAVVVYRTHALWGKKVQESVFIASSLLLAGFGIWFMVSGFQVVF
jgi:threonine/homoserine/homoserine lactone efflux protein